MGDSPIRSRIACLPVNLWNLSTMEKKGQAQQLAGLEDLVNFVGRLDWVTILYGVR